MLEKMSYNKIVIERKLREFLEEDCNFKDCSSEFIPEGAQSSAKIIAKSDGYISGLAELKILFDLLDVESDFKKNDGDSINIGEIIVLLNGRTRNILLGERVGLNLCMHMSAITTTTKKLVDIIKQHSKKTRIASTRKTNPGLRIFEKKAVEIGGGDTHRFSLDDMILLKDTHLKYYKGNIKKLLVDAKNTSSFSKKIEIEVENMEDMLIAAENGVDIIMLDNMTPEQIKQAIDLLKMNNIREKVSIEISGGINRENLIEYLEFEPDIISTSELTQNTPEKIDLSLRFE